MRLSSWSLGLAAGSAAAALGLAASAQAQTVYAITVQGNLISFNVNTPGAITTIGAISGTSGSAGDYRGIDFRSANSQLYLLQGAQGANPDRLYALNIFSGAATLIGGASAPVNGSPLGIDFNPVADRLRVITSSTNNYNINPDTVVNTTETAATIAGSGNSPFITGAAYTNALFGAAAATTTLYTIDSRNSTLNTVIPPGGGVNTPVGSLGVDLNASATDAGFDIFFTGSQNIGYMSANPGGAGQSTFYRVDLATGAATAIGTIGGGVAIRDIAIIPAPGAGALALLGVGLLARRRR
jgi:hypothetical protein